MKVLFRYSLPVFLFLSLAFAQAPLDVARALQEAYRGLAKNAMPAVVSIQVESSRSQRSSSPFPFEDFFPGFPFPFENQPAPEQKRKQVTGSGTGFLISADGYLISNHHVIENAETIWVYLFGNEDPYEAKVIGSDPDSDLALLKIEGKSFPYLEIESGENVEIGDLVVAIGNPFGLNHTYTSGVVSATGRKNIGSGPKYQDFIQTDVAINPGNSGGPLINLDGRVVGINSMILSRSGGNIGIGFAIPASMASGIIDQLRSTGKVVRGYLGISIRDLDKENAEVLDLEGGVYIPEVLKDGPADKAGIREGDIVLYFNNKKMKTADDLLNAVANTAPGTEVVLKLLRKGKERDLQVKVGSKKNDKVVNSSEAGSELKNEKLGMVLAEATLDGKTVVVLEKIENGSPLRGKGLRSGAVLEMISYNEVKSLRQSQDLLDKSVQEGRIILHFRQGNSLRMIAFTL